ncbi:MAG: hypothetical protein K2K41_05640 [Ruminiclostridium sp.]|nr:hypothetical protein [Ruminiclostridium sp.]
MKKLATIIVSLALSVFSSVQVFADKESTVKIDMDKTYQTIDGFGASYTWYSEWLSRGNAAQQGFDWIFNDAKFNIIRFRDLNCVYTNDYNDILDGYKTNYYLYYNAALERGIDPLILVTSWGEYDRSLPWVEFVENPENSYSYYTLAKDENGEYMYGALADFCVESIKIFFDAGIPVNYFSITNEAELQDSHLDEQGGSRDSAGFFFGKEETDYQAAYWKAHIAVYEAFQKAFGERAPQLMGAETMAAYPNLLHGYLDPLLESRPESFEIVAHHLYGTDLSEKNLTAVGQLFPNYKIWQTEYYNADFFGNAEIILDDLVYEGVNAYLYWDGVWPNGALMDVSISDGVTTLTRRGNHYIMSHFSAFIDRGYQRVDVQDDLNTKFAAFKSPDESKLIVIAMNPTQNSESLNIDLGGKNISSSKVYISTENVEDSSKNKYMQDSGEYHNDLVIPGRSLTTIEIDLTDLSSDLTETTEAETDPAPASSDSTEPDLAPVSSNLADNTDDENKNTGLMIDSVPLVFAAAVAAIAGARRRK